VATLITGLGYVGAALARRLLDEGNTVVGVENFFSTPRPPVAQLSEHGRFVLIEGSVAQPAAVERAFRAAPIDTVFHTTPRRRQALIQPPRH
jgi:nucleoside-diphosphate-sugar epimerase